MIKKECDDQEFRALFTVGFKKGLMNFKNKYKFEWTNLRLVKDTPRATVWRKKFFDGYKGCRDKGYNQEFDPTIFAYVYDELLPKLIEVDGLEFKTLYYETAEADDVIAVAHMVIREKDKDADILIMTNDHDYLQLHDKNTLIVNAKDLEIISRIPEEALEVFLEWKIIKGDISDSIPSIAKKVGEKTALKLAKDPVLLKKKLESSPEIQKQYDLNRILISFDSIPVDIVEGIKSIIL
jgi:5'-3' exonuclease